ncbi:kinase domain-containing protein [Pochonia chlamydosporia 170]|uniref:Kinase domain-containing protein n=1 Tax=Pochonia chlamydosporia 170 TaxID=1380566 RepID=A0A179EZX6_METCM|nr:kinase domain-containing protein [Pochonia chlamydosporia 170]OAQ58757.1 kinase domain-containing protein [Pochonia chlamydosporia 170]
MSYPIYKVAYLGLPRNHHATFVETDANGGGVVFHVTGDIQNGMRFETKAGLSYIRTPIDVFDLPGDGGTHKCLVFEPMRETLSQFQQRLPRQRLGLSLFKAYMFCLLQALDYLHTDCRLIHTGMSLDDNIMVTIEDDSVLEDLVHYYKTNSQPRHIRKEDGRVMYLSHDEFGGLRGTNFLPQLTDFNLCFPGFPDNRGHISPIQSHRYPVPEVFLGCPWSYGADIWNLGLMQMWNLLENTSLFDHPAGDDGQYDAHGHLAHMVSMLGDPPAVLIQRERMCRKAKLGRVIVNPKGKECEIMNEFWGGPFFDKDGTLRNAKGETQLSDTVTELAGEEKRQFLDFAGSMLQWLPEKRKTAKELVQHPFLEDLKIP